MQPKCPKCGGPSYFSALAGGLCDHCLAEGLTKAVPWCKMTNAPLDGTVIFGVWLYYPDEPVYGALHWYTRNTLDAHPTSSRQEVRP